MWLSFKKCKQISSLSLKQCFGGLAKKKKIGISRKEIKLMLEAKRLISRTEKENNSVDLIIFEIDSLVEAW